MANAATPWTGVNANGAWVVGAGPPKLSRDRTGVAVVGRCAAVSFGRTDVLWKVATPRVVVTVDEPGVGPLACRPKDAGTGHLTRR